MKETKQYIKPTKFNAFYEAMKKLVSDPKSVILTDEEIWVLVNAELPYEEQVSYSTFEKWKSPTGKKNVESNSQISDEEAAGFRACLAVSRAKQKMVLTGNMLDEDNKNQWGSSWILERKFEDLRKEPQIQLNNNPQNNNTAGDKEGAMIIDQIINGETIDIDHKEVDRERVEE